MALTERMNGMGKREDRSSISSIELDPISKLASQRL